MPTNPTVPGDTSDSPPPDRRASQRLLLSPARGCVVFTSGGQSHATGAVLDVSTGGMCLVLNHLVDVRTLIRVELCEGPIPLRYRIRACVVHTVVDAGGGYLVGVAFDEPLGPDDVQALAE